MGIVYIIGIVQAFFIEFLLLNKKKKNLSDKILAVWIFFLGIHLFLYYLLFIEYHQQYPIVLGLAVPLPLVHGPFLLFYVSSLISKHQGFKRLHLLHFIPSFTYYALLVPIFILPLEGQRAFVFEQIPIDPPLYVIIFNYLVDVSGVVYVTWSLILLRKHQKNIGDNFSYTDKINLIWLRNVIIGMALIWIAVLAGNFLEDLESSNLVFGTVVLFIFLIGYFGIRQGAIFTNRFADSPGSKEPAVKYQKSKLNSEQIQKYLDQLLALMDEEKPHLESRLTLPKLAGKLSLSHNYLSQIINEQLKQNFYDFINSYRVEEFKQRVEKDKSDRFTLLAHAHESGFSSKSSFNEVFKKITSIAPSEYQRQLKSRNSPE